MKTAWICSVLASLGCSSWPREVIGLRPIEPGPPDYHATSLRVFLRWEEWVGAEVRYDLRVFDSGNDGPRREIYLREGLLTSEHRLDIELLPGRTYFWTVRAWYRVDDRPRVTPWARFTGKKSRGRSLDHGFPLVTPPPLDSAETAP